MPGEWGPVITAMVTPFTEKGDVNYAAAEKMAVHLAESGSTGLLLAGSTGESPVLSTTEKTELFRVVAGAVKGKAAVIAGTGCNSTAASSSLTELASSTGVEGIMLVTPYYNKPTQEGLYEHFRTVASSTNLPVMVYNVPARTGVNMTAETTLRLAGIDNVAAIKEAAGCLEQAAEICEHAPSGFMLYAGDDVMTLPFLSIGAFGVVSVASNLVGSRVAELIGHFRNGRVQEAARLHRMLLPLFRGLFMSTNPIPVKAALNMMGFAAGDPRLPLLPLETGLSGKLEKLLQRYRLIG